MVRLVLYLSAPDESAYRQAKEFLETRGEAFVRACFPPKPSTKIAPCSTPARRIVHVRVLDEGVDPVGLDEHCVYLPRGLHGPPLHAFLEACLESVLITQNLSRTF
jgi:hypothetical protein